MLLSIIIPVYNVESYIRECLESIFSLPLLTSEYEIIVVNDGTTDNSMLVVNEYDGKRNIHIINQVNKGLGAARNTGLKKAQGDWVYFVDSDDYIDAIAFSKLLNKARSGKEIDIVVGDYYFVKDKQIHQSKYSIKTTEDINQTGKSFFQKYYPVINTMVWRSLYRRSFLLENGFYFSEGVYHEDINWTPKCLVSARCISYTPTPFYYYRVREGSIIQSSKTKKKLNDLLYLYDDLLKYFTKYDKSLQKMISGIVFENLLVINGQYGIYKDERYYNRLMSLLMTPYPLYFRDWMLLFLYKRFPNIFNFVLDKRYGGGVNQNTF